MGGLKAPGDSEYDVLGLSTRATADEINGAFHQLIEEGGFREGVPLRSQWQRAREIKAAHATLSDPASRAKYDESLSRVAAPPAFSDAGEHEVPVAGQPDPVQIAPAVLPPAAPSALSAFEWGPGSDGTAHRPRHVLVPDLDPPAPAEEPVLAEADSDTAPGAFAYEADEEIGGERERFSPRALAFAGTGVLAAGLLLYVFAPEATRPGRSGMVTGPELSTPVRAGPEQGSPVLAEVPAATPDAQAETPPMAGEGDEAPPLAEPVATVAEAPPSQGQQGGASALERRAATQPAVAVANAATLRTPPVAPARSAPAGSNPQYSRTIILSPTPQQVAAASPSAPRIAPGVSDAPASGRALPRARSSPARFISGGPTNADNRGGRFRGTVGVEFTVGANGGVSGCVTRRSSGDAALDGMTCRLVEQRVRYNPAMDALGRPTASTASATYVWGRRRRP